MGGSGSARSYCKLDATTDRTVASSRLDEEFREHCNLLLVRALRRSARAHETASSARAYATARSQSPTRSELRARAIRRRLRCSHFSHRWSTRSHATDAAEAARRGRIAGPPTSRNNETFSSVADDLRGNHRRAARSQRKSWVGHRESRREVRPRTRCPRLATRMRCAGSKAPGRKMVALRVARTSPKSARS